MGIYDDFDFDDGFDFEYDQKLIAGLDAQMAKAMIEFDTEIWFYVAKGGAVTGYILDATAVVRDAGYSPRVNGFIPTAVRIVREPASVPGDPDVDRSATPSSRSYIMYAGAEPVGQVYVESPGVAPGMAPTPFDCRGIGVDRRYLWVFNSDGFACASHASVIRCRKGEISSPRWMTHQPNDLLYSEDYRRYQAKVTRRSPLRGLLDLSPSDDGTLAAAISQRTVLTGKAYHKIFYNFDDQANPPLYTATYEIDIKAPAIAVHWTKLPEATTGICVQKLPTRAWSMLTGLGRMLSALDADQAPQVKAAGA
jgi:hypothetical protein